MSIPVLHPLHDGLNHEMSVSLKNGIKKLEEEVGDSLQQVTWVNVSASRIYQAFVRLKDQIYTHNVLLHSRPGEYLNKCFPFASDAITSICSSGPLLYGVVNSTEIYCVLLQCGHPRKRSKIKTLEAGNRILQIATSEKFIFVRTDNRVYVKDRAALTSDFKPLITEKRILQIEATKEYLFVLLENRDLRIFSLCRESSYYYVGVDELLTTKAVKYVAPFKARSFAVSETSIQFDCLGKKSMPVMSIDDVVREADTQKAFVQLIRQIMNYKCSRECTGYQRKRIEIFLNYLGKPTHDGFFLDRGMLILYLKDLKADATFISKRFFRSSNMLDWIKTFLKFLDDTLPENLKDIYPVRKQLPRLREEAAAAVKVQAFYRGYCVRKQLPRLREEAVQRSREEAAEILAQQRHKKHVQIEGFYKNRDSAEFSLAEEYLVNDDL